MKRIPIERLKEVLRLDGETGRLYWKEKIASKVVVGREAGSANELGYRHIQINKVQILAHHIVFAMVHARWPVEVDHINRNPSDNRPSNLREATRSENNMNRVTKRPCASSGLRGVFMQARGATWHARLKKNGRVRRISGFATKELAAEFLSLWREMAHGEFATHEMTGAF